MAENKWTYLNIANFHSRVQSLLNDTSVTTQKIDMPEKAPAAELKIKSLVTNWEILQTEDEEKFKIFESCVVYQTAIYFENYTMQRQIKRRETPSINIEYSTSGNIKQGQLLSLSDELEELLSLLMATEEKISRFYGFRVT